MLLLLKIPYEIFYNVVARSFDLTISKISVEEQKKLKKIF